MIFNRDKMLKWAEENHYKVARDWSFEITLIKDIKMKHSYTQTINYIYFNNRFSSYICTPIKIDSKETLEEMFIPLNNVKRDEKLLREYMMKGTKIQNSSAYGVVGKPHTPTSEELEDIFRKED